MVKIFLEHLTKTFKEKGKEVIAVKDLNLEISHKSIVGILGPSGCGKTTTLRMIAGLTKPSSGRILFDDKDVTSLPPRERNVALMFQFPVVYDTMTVFENLSLPLRVHDVKKEEINKKVRDIAEFLGLTNILYKKAKGLSAAINQKIALGRALIRDPDVLLLDEPLSSLDPETRLYFRRELKEVIKSMESTVVYVTHDQSEAMTLCDKIAVMNEGSLIQYDTPENIYSIPADKFVGWFIGEPGMNFIDVSLKLSDNKILLLLDEYIKFDVSKWSDNLKGSEEIILGIRPELIEISREKGLNSLPAKCVAKEIFSSYALLGFEAKNLIIKVKTTSIESLPEEDEVMYLNFPPENVRLYDKKSGKLLVVMR
ncbi:MAG: ABC transporter ATP-binding protein [Nitrososphaeria archaeon]